MGPVTRSLSATVSVLCLLAFLGLTGGAARAQCPDQDANGICDSADTRTYDFEADSLGVRPSAMTQQGGSDTTFQVRSFSGDKGASYAAGTGGRQDRFDRVPLSLPQQDVTVFVDYSGSGGACSLELWSDGASSWNAGSGLTLQIDTAGNLALVQRRGNALTTTPGPAAPATGRIRVRLIKGAGTTSVMRVDAWTGAAWTLDHAVFNIADDHLRRGLWTTIARHSGGSRGVTRVTIAPVAPAGAFTVRKDATWSSDWKVFQRDSNGNAVIPLRFTYRLASAGRVEARIIRVSDGSPLPGHDWSDHVQNLAAGDGIDGALNLAGVPTGGNYDVQARLVRASDSATLGTGTLGSVAVGDVYLCGGQSNMAGYSGNFVGGESPIDEVHLFGNDAIWKRGSEPMDGGTDQVDLVSSENPVHSLMLAFAKRLHESNGVPVGIIPGPLGGTNLHSQWQRDASDHRNRGTLYGSLVNRGLLQGYAMPVAGYLWFQGESDAGRGTALYRQDLERLISQVREDLGDATLPFFIAQLGTYTGADIETWAPIQEAQRQVDAADANAALITTCDQPLSDAIHYSVAGYREIGARFALAARKHVHGENVVPLVNLVQAKKGKGKRLELVYDGPVTGGEAYLYKVETSVGPREVRGVSTSGNVVTLSLDRGLRGTVNVSYALPTDFSPFWVRDARNVPVAIFWKVPVAM